MKNKEIEELLNKLKDNDDWYIIENKEEHNIEPYKLLLPTERDLLLSQIEQLEKRNKELYEGFMATQEELTDYATKNEQLEKENKLQKERIAYLERSNNRREDTIISLQDELIDVETNIDDSIEMLETYKRMLSLYSQPVNIFDLQDVIDELKGDSDE